MGCLYWAIAIVAFLLNVLYITASIQHNFRNKPAITNCLVHPNCSIPSDESVYKDEVLTVLAVYIIIPSAVFTELFVSVLAAFRHQKSLRHIGQCPSCNQHLLQGFHVFALWNILVAIQLITMIATPICASIHPPTSDCPLYHISVNGAC